MRKFIVIMSLLLVTAASASTGCTRIGPGHVGIKVSNAGSDRGVNKDAIATGWVFYNPIFSSVYEWPTYVQQVVLTASKDDGNPVNEEISFTNADNMEIKADIGFSYSLDGNKVPEFFNKFLTDDMQKFSHGYMRSLIRDKFNEVGSKYKIEQIMGDNAQFIAEVKQSVQVECVPFGVKLESQFGFIGAPRPPKAVVDMINSKVAAVQLAQQKQNELVQAQADAAKQVATTEGRAKSILIEAKAQADANRLLSESITSNLIEIKRIEKWNGVYPLATGGAMPYLPLK